MSTHAKRFALLIVALSVVAVALVACQTPAATGTTQGQTGGVNVFHTPTPPAPTPTFPPFTIGAWPSNFSPNNSDTITIYALCRVQNQAMTGPAQPPSAGTPVTFSAQGLGTGATRPTDADGLASWTFQISGASVGQPIVVQVTASYNGQTYQNTTFFTVSPANAPKPTKTPGGNGNGPPGGTPSATPGGPPQGQ